MNITEVEDLTQFCRVCLQVPEESELLDLNLIYDEEEQLSYYDCFTVCTQINLSEGEGLPQNLCRSCGMELQIAYDFYKKVEDSKRFLAQIHEQQAGMSSEDMIEETSQTVSQDVEQEEHLEIEEFQGVEQLEEEENVEYIIVEKSPEYENYSTIEAKIASQVDGTKSNYKGMQQQLKVANITHYDHLIANEVATESVNAVTTTRPEKQKLIAPIKTDTATATTTTTALSPQNYSKCFVKPQIVCDICRKTFTTKTRMLWHRKIHDKNRVKFPCPDADCKRVYSTKQACDVHFKQSHLVEGLVCPVCSKVFIVRQSLEVHLRYHTGEYPYVCKICDKRYGQKGHLTTHMQVKHNNLRYYCPEPGCMKIFKNSMSLRNHRFIHTEMPFKCAYCEKGYPQKSKLKVHINVKHNLDVSFEDLELMRRFQDSRTHYSFLKVAIEDEDDEMKEDVAAIEEIVVTEPTEIILS